MWNQLKVTLLSRKSSAINNDRSLILTLFDFANKNVSNRLFEKVVKISKLPSQSTSIHKSLEEKTEAPVRQDL